MLIIDYRGLDYPLYIGDYHHPFWESISNNQYSGTATIFASDRGFDQLILGPVFRPLGFGFLFTDGVLRSPVQGPKKIWRMS